MTIDRGSSVLLCPRLAKEPEYELGAPVAIVESLAWDADCVATGR